MSNTAENKYLPNYTVPPGEILEEELESRGMSQVELSERTGLAKKTINEIINAKAAITPESAIKFERVFRQPAEYWLNLENLYREALAREKEYERLESEVAWLDGFPIARMVKLGWIRKFADKATQLNELLAFFGIAQVSQWDGVWKRLTVAYRRSDAVISHAEAISAWLRQGEIEAQSLNCAPFDERAFKQALGEIRFLTKESDPQVFVPKLEELCASCGVAVVLVPELPRMGVSGATRWLNKDKAIIQLSLRYKSDDHLWFTFFHESGHILKHGKKALFLEENGNGLGDAQEQEANEFASNWLIPSAQFNSFVSRGCFTKANITSFADELGISPGIVLGQLQHYNWVDWATKLNTLKQRFRWNYDS